MKLKVLTAANLHLIATFLLATLPPGNAWICSDKEQLDTNEALASSDQDPPQPCGSLPLPTPMFNNHPGPAEVIDQSLYLHSFIPTQPPKTSYRRVQSG